MKKTREVPNEAPWLFELSEISDNSESEKRSDGESNPYAAIPIYSSNVHKNDFKKIFEMRKIKSSMNKFF